MKVVRLVIEDILLHSVHQLSRLLISCLVQKLYIPINIFLSSYPALHETQVRYSFLSLDISTAIFCAILALFFLSSSKCACLACSDLSLLSLACFCLKPLASSAAWGSTRVLVARSLMIYSATVLLLQWLTLRVESLWRIGMSFRS